MQIGPESNYNMITFGLLLSLGFLTDQIQIPIACKVSDLILTDLILHINLLMSRLFQHLPYCENHSQTVLLIKPIIL